MKRTKTGFVSMILAAAMILGVVNISGLSAFAAGEDQAVPEAVGIAPEEGEPVPEEAPAGSEENADVPDAAPAPAAGEEDADVPDTAPVPAAGEEGADAPDAAPAAVEAVEAVPANYVVTFTFGSARCVLSGGITADLAEILGALGISAEGGITAAVSSAPALFTAEDTGAGWILSSLQPFTSGETLTVTVGGTEYVIDVTDAEIPVLWVGGHKVTNANLTDVLGDGSGSVQYDPDSGTLTLDHPNITGNYAPDSVSPEKTAIIYAAGTDLIIAGTVDMYQNGSGFPACYGIWVAGSGSSLTFKGSDTDIVVRGTRPGESNSGTCGIYCEGTLTVESGSVTAYGNTTIYAAGDLVINGGKVTAKGKTGSIYGIYTSGNFTMNYGNVTADAGYGHAIFAVGDLTVNNGVVYARNYDHNATGYSPYSAILSRDGDVVINGGYMECEAHNSSGESYGIAAPQGNVRFGENIAHVIVTSGTAAVYARQDVTMTANLHFTAPQGGTIGNVTDYLGNKRYASVFKDETNVARDVIIGPRLRIEALTITGVTLPRAGEHPVYDGIRIEQEGVSVHYGTNYPRWVVWNGTDWTSMTPDQTFQAGERYAIWVMLDADADHLFADKGTMMVNSTVNSYKPSDVVVNSGNERMVVYCEMPELGLFVVTAGALNVRAVPDANGVRVGGLHYGDIVVPRAQYGNWIMIDYVNGEGEPQAGWVSRQYLAYTYSEDTAFADGPQYYTVNVGALNVRDDVSTGANRPTEMTQGTQVLATGVRENSEGTWLVIDYEYPKGSGDHHLGYMLFSYVSTSTGNTIYTFNLTTTPPVKEPAEEDEPAEELVIDTSTYPHISFVPFRAAVSVGDPGNAGHSAALTDENYEVQDENHVTTTIYPDDAWNFRNITIDKIRLPEVFTERGMVVRELILNDDGSITLKIGPEHETYSISFDLGGGTLDGETGTVTWMIEEGTVITLPAPTREGYTFDYWQGSRYEAGASYTVEGDHAFTAMWKVNETEGGAEGSSGNGGSGAGAPGGTTPSGAASPLTADSSPTAFYGFLMAASLAAVAVSLISLRKRQRT